jgi:hypothetical protein
MQIKDQNTDFETRSLDTVCVNESELKHHHNIKYLVVGVLFGIFIKAKLLGISHSGNVPFPVFSYVWTNRKCSGSSIHFSYKKIQH